MKNTIMKAMIKKKVKKKIKKKAKILKVSVASKTNMSMPKSFIIKIVEGVKDVFTRN